MFLAALLVLGGLDSFARRTELEEHGICAGPRDARARRGGTVSTWLIPGRGGGRPGGRRSPLVVVGPCSLPDYVLCAAAEQGSLV